MAKTTTRTKSLKTNRELNARGRDAEFPSAPIRVSEHGLAKGIDVRAARQFNFERGDPNKLPERPSTSGGPTNQSMRKSSEKRETRDDINFNPSAVHGKGTTFYNFPLPGKLPTTGLKHNISSPVSVKSSLYPSNTTDSVSSRSMALNAEETQIGMALGSPSHQPHSWPQLITVIESNINSPSPDHDVAGEGWADTPLPEKHKARKWKVFGGLFGGSRKNSTPQAFYQVQPEMSPLTNAGSDHNEIDEAAITRKKSEKKASKPRSRGRTMSERKSSKQKPELEKAQTPPLVFDFREIDGRMQAPMPQITIDGRPMVDSIHQSNHPRNNHGGPMLDVAIPSVQMERYSIMFGSVLDKSVSTNTTSSLLARRKATLDKLKTVHEELVIQVSFISIGHF